MDLEEHTEEHTEELKKRLSIHRSPTLDFETAITCVSRLTVQAAAVRAMTPLSIIPVCPFKGWSVSKKVEIVKSNVSLASQVQLGHNFVHLKTKKHLSFNTDDLEVMSCSLDNEELSELSSRLGELKSSAEDKSSAEVTEPDAGTTTRLSCEKLEAGLRAFFPVCQGLAPIKRRWFPIVKLHEKWTFMLNAMGVTIRHMETVDQLTVERLLRLDSSFGEVCECSLNHAQIQELTHILAHFQGSTEESAKSKKGLLRFW